VEIRARPTPELVRGLNNWIKLYTTTAK
jgi:hypothetical protein